MCGEPDSDGVSAANVESQTLLGVFEMVLHGDRDREDFPIPPRATVTIQLWGGQIR